jgi:hypothetical protein
LVASFMAVQVIDGLEAIQIQETHRAALSGATAAGERLLHAVGQ